MGNKRRVRTRPVGRTDLSNYQAVDFDEPQEPQSVEVEEMHMFTFRGVEYYAPVQVPFREALASLDVAATQGEAAAIVRQMKLVLGEDGYRALLQIRDIRDDQFEQIAAAISQIVMASAGKA